MFAGHYLSVAMAPCKPAVENNWSKLPTNTRHQHIFVFTAVKVKKTMKNLNVVQTQDAVFSLELTHEDVRGAQWIKNGVEIQPNDKYEIFTEGTVHILKIKNCTTQDESVYSFRLGKLSANARLNVESKQSLIWKNITTQGVKK